MGVRRVGAMAMAAMLAVGLTACGDDGDDSEDVALEEVDEGGSASGTEETDESDDEVTDEESDESEDTDGDVDLGFGSERCQELFGALSGFGAAFTGDEGELDFGDFGEAFDEMADEAPEIADDLEVLAEAYRDFDEAFGGDAIDFSDPDILTSDEFIEAGEAFATPEFTEASNAVSEFLDEECS